MTVKKTKNSDGVWVLEVQAPDSGEILTLHTKNHVNLDEEIDPEKSFNRFLNKIGTEGEA